MFVFEQAVHGFGRNFVDERGECVYDNERDVERKLGLAAR